MGYDWTITDGDTAPAYDDTLTLEDGSVPNFAGATVQFVMRSLTQDTPLTLTGSALFTNTATGTVQFSPTAADTTGNAGAYIARWRVTFADGRVMSFPTTGVISVLIDENPLTSAGGQLVTLPEAKQHLRISAGDRTQDAALIRAIRDVRPVVEHITGPIIPQTFTEWHQGGHYFLNVRRRPSSVYGTTPILELTSVTEYVGSTPHTLALVDDPSMASTYSCMLDSLGTITRRTGGGGRTAFAGDVHVVYRAGQSEIPGNVRDGTLELLRVNWQTSRPTGVGRMSSADELDTGAPLGFYVPRSVRERLAPNRRAPSVA